MGQSHAPPEPSAARIKACLPCAKVKARCEVDNGNQACNRCRRLKKTCTGQAPGAHRRTKAVTTKTARIDDSSEGTQSPAESADTFIDRIINSNIEGNAILQTYRENHEPQFPFVVIDPSSRFEDLRENKPLLLLAVLMVGLRTDLARQECISRRIREIISRDLLNDHKDFDLLQCLLVYANWYHLHLHLGSQFNNIIHLIMSTVVELGLNKEASSKFPVSGLGRFGFFGPAGSVLSMGAPEGNVSRTLDQRRAFLGSFFLTSVTSLCIRDIEPLIYSKYAEACCSTLIDAAEYPTDVYAAYLARIHGVACSYTHVLSQDDCRRPLVLPAASVDASIAAAETSLAMLASTLPLELRQNALLSVQYHVIQIFLYDGAIDLGSEDSGHSISPLARSRMLERCQEATTLCFDAFYSIPHSQLFDLSYTTLNLIGHAIVVSSKLNLLRVRDAAMLQSSLDFSSAITRLIQGIDHAVAIARDSTDDSTHEYMPESVPLVFRRLPDTLRKIEAVHEAMAASQSKMSSQQPQSLFPYMGDSFTWEDLFETSVQSFPEVFTEDFFPLA